jgi:hypothetical protein
MGVDLHSQDNPIQSAASRAAAVRGGLTASRRWPRLRLVLLLLAGTVFCGWFGAEMTLAGRQRAAVREVWNLGGYVGRAHDKPGTESRVPARLRRLLGDDFLNRVVVVRLAATAAGDKDMVAVGRLKDLRMLDLRDTQVGDAGLQCLGTLKDVRLLILHGTAVSDDGLAQLRNMPQLEVLFLEETKTTDRGLQHLKGLPNLRYLDLSGTQVTEAGLICLRDCPRLEVLVLAGCGVSDERLDELTQALPGTRVFGSSVRAPYCPHPYW